MKIYFTLHQVPELASLSKEEIRVVCAECVTPAWRRYYSFFWLLAIALGVVGCVAGNLIFREKWGTIFGCVLGSQVGFQIYMQVIFERSRPEIRRYLEELKYERQPDV